MKTFYSILVSLILSSCIYAQSGNQEILTVTVQWASTPVGQSVAYICSPDGTIKTQELEGKLNIKGIPDATSALTVLLNQITKDGWVLMSTSTLKDSFNAHLFIFEKQ